jgi:uncharacterized protein YndB with AHSA1/START domain
MNTNRIEKKIVLRAPQSRVWRALTNAQEFGRWFRVELDGGFIEGSVVRGKITYPGYEHLKWEACVERLEPEKYFAYRWHPYAVDPNVDYSLEPTTLVEFRLEAEEGGTLLNVVESGFDELPEVRRDETFRMDEGGWAEQMLNIERHISES